MDYNIKFYRRAEEDIHAIDDYLAENAPQADVKFMDHLRELVQLLKRFPFMGKKSEFLAGSRRIVLVYGYILFYRVNEDEKAIEILRVLHGKRRIEPSIFIE